MDIVRLMLDVNSKGFGYKDSTEQHNMLSALHQLGYNSRIILITVVNRCIKITMPYTIKFILTVQT